MQYLYDVNFLAVLVSAVVAFLLGAVWYSPLFFAKQWIEIHADTPQKLKALRAGAKKAYAVSFACLLVMAAAMAMLVAITNMSTAFAGIKLGVLCWLGFAATAGLLANLYSDKPVKSFLLDAGYQLLYFAVMGAILAAWR